MIEESIVTFDTYCKYVDSSSLAADQGLAQQYLSIVQIYTSFASYEHLSNPKIKKNLPLVVRWRLASLKAIRSVVGSDALATDSAKQLNVVIPVILENLYLEEDDILVSLQQRAQTSEKLDLETARKRRISIATVTTVDTVDADPATASGTTADADKVAQEEVRVVAVRCLKQIFAADSSSHRGQIRSATALTLRFIASRNPPQTSVAPFRPSLARAGNWATSLIEAIARWTPVQDRFIIMVTAMETLVRSPVVESALKKQLALATMIDWLLSSPVNLIGLSVMDVLLGFVNHSLLLLQLDGRNWKTVPHYQQSDALDLFRDTQETFDLGEEQERGRELTSKEDTPSQVRQELLLRLQKCIANLATHIYYTDQVTDMMTAILARLKPSGPSDVTSAATAIDDPSAAARAIANSSGLQEDSTTDGFFSFATARIMALRAIKDVLMIANYRRTAAGNAVEARSRVGIQVWEGTQWLLRDEDRDVRVAYVDALLTWLKLETNKIDLHLPKDGPRKKTVKKETQENGEVKLARRAASGASRKENKTARSTFLQLLHLAVYDGALESPENESDILLLHLLLTTLIERLGVNAVRTGLPMILKLQETVLNGEAVETPRGKINVASLVHGYLWSLTEKFNFETSSVGNEINAEISRRKRFAMWFQKIKFPALSIDHITTSPLDEKTSEISEDALGTLKPYLNIPGLVDEVATAYDAALVTSSASPPSSPGRVFSVPTLGFGYAYGVSPGPRPSPEDELPQKVRDEMLSGWSRESCLAAAEREGSKTASMSGSRTGTSRHLVVNGGHANGTASGHESPITPHVDGGTGNHPPNYGLFGGLSTLQRLRRVSTVDGSPIPLTPSSSHESTMRVTDLKRALAGCQSDVRHPSPLRRPIPRRQESAKSSGSDSIVSFHDADDPDVQMDEVSPIDLNNPNEASAAVSSNQVRPGSSASKRATVQGTVLDEAALLREMSDPRLGDDVPPVPRIPSSLNLPGTYPRDVSPVPDTSKSGKQRANGESTGASPKSQRHTSGRYTSTSAARESRSIKRGNSRPTSSKGTGIWSEIAVASTTKVDLGKLLAGIHPGNDAVVAQEMEDGGVLTNKPPY
jgi:protein EFR3